MAGQHTGLDPSLLKFNPQWPLPKQPLKGRLQPLAQQRPEVARVHAIAQARFDEAAMVLHVPCQRRMLLVNQVSVGKANRAGLMAAHFAEHELVVEAVKPLELRNNCGNHEGGVA